MLRDIRNGSIAADLILVDTMERLGRNDRMSAIRKEMRNHHGVIILTADTGFADPTTSSGRTNDMLQEWRATEENRVKAYQVSRGKLDAVRQRFWPGGPTPFGFRLESASTQSHGRRKAAESKLIVYEPEAQAIRLLFEQALECNSGAPQLTKYLNAHPELRQLGNTFHSSTVDSWLSNPIYIGTFVYKKFSVDVVDDFVVRQRNPEDQRLYIDQFCPAIVDTVQFSDVQALRSGRKKKQILRGEDDGKQIKPQLRSTSVKYCLAGLVRCGACGASMTPTSRRNRDERRHAYYRCPLHTDGTCGNRRHVPISWLDGVVMGALSQSLFGSAVVKTFDAEEIHSPNLESDRDWSKAVSPEVDALLVEVRRELQNLQQPSVSPLPAISQQIIEIEKKMRGWMVSLGDSENSPEVRRLLQKELADAVSHKRLLENRRREIESISATQEIACNRELIIDRLSRLAEVMAKANPSRLNLELSLHVDTIRCGAEGNVILRVCSLGAFSNAMTLLRNDDHVPMDIVTTDAAYKVKARRRATMKLYGDEGNTHELRDLADFAGDPDRFAGIGEKWFQELTFSIPQTMGWAEKNSLAVAERRKQGLTVDALAADFKVTPPTIRRALKFAAVADDELKSLPRKMARARWHEDHADEAFRLYQSGSSMDELAGRFRKCTETVRKAIAIGKRRSSENQS